MSEILTNSRTELQDVACLKRYMIKLTCNVSNLYTLRYFLRVQQHYGLFVVRLADFGLGLCGSALFGTGRVLLSRDAGERPGIFCPADGQRRSATNGNVKNPPFFTSI